MPKHAKFDTDQIRILQETDHKSFLAFLYLCDVEWR